MAKEKEPQTLERWIDEYLRGLAKMHVNLDSKTARDVIIRELKRAIPEVDWNRAAKKE